MTTRIAAMTIVAATALVVGCESAPAVDNSPDPGGADQPEEAVDQPQQDIEPQQYDDPLEIRFSPPAEDDRIAEFKIARGRDMHTDNWPTLVLYGDQERFIPPAETTTFDVAAHPTRLQHLEVGNDTVLVHFAPGEQYGIHDDPCYFWRLDGPGLTPLAAGEPEAACVAKDQSCPDGMAPVRRGALAEDPLCSDEIIESGEWQRCIQEATIVIRTDTDATFQNESIDDTLHTTVKPGGCGFPVLETPQDEFHLAAPAGARWDITVDERGDVSGEVIEQTGEK